MMLLLQMHILDNPSLQKCLWIFDKCPKEVWFAWTTRTEHSVAVKLLRGASQRGLSKEFCFRLPIRGSGTEWNILEQRSSGVEKGISGRFRSTMVAEIVLKAAGNLLPREVFLMGVKEHQEEKKCSKGRRTVIRCETGGCRVLLPWKL